MKLTEKLEILAMEHENIARSIRTTITILNPDRTENVRTAIISKKKKLHWTQRPENKKRVMKHIRRIARNK